jgi:cell surface protein SprA
VNRELGYISLNSRLQNNEVLFVAYEYTVIGDPSNKVYKVGEFSQDVPGDTQDPNVLFLKMLKRSSVNPVDDQGKQYPAWDLMMKNIYNINGYNLKPEDLVSIDKYPNSYKHNKVGELKSLKGGLKNTFNQIVKVLVNYPDLSQSPMID